MIELVYLRVLSIPTFVATTSWSVSHGTAGTIQLPEILQIIQIFRFNRKSPFFPAFIPEPKSDFDNTITYGNFYNVNIAFLLSFLSSLLFYFTICSCEH